MGDYLGVVPDGEGFSVVTVTDGGHVRWYDNRLSAWHHACWAKFAPGEYPKIGPGGWFVSDSGKGWTSDPRFAVPVAVESMTAEEQQMAEAAVIRFIQHQLPGHVGDMDSLTKQLKDYARENGESMTDNDKTAIPMPEDEAIKQDAPEAAEDAPEDVASEGVEESADDAAEDVREALSDSDRQAFDNFTHLAETAPTDQGREFWQAKADEILSGETE